AGRDGNGDAVAGRAWDGGLVPDRDPERPAPVLAQAAAPGTGGCDHRACPHHRELTMAILLFLIPISLLLLGVAVWAFVWSVRGGQYDDLDTAPLDILRDDDPPPPAPPKAK